MLSPGGPAGAAAPPLLVLASTQAQAPHTPTQQPAPPQGPPGLLTCGAAEGGEEDAWVQGQRDAHQRRQQQALADGGAAKQRAPLAQVCGGGGGGQHPGHRHQEAQHAQPLAVAGEGRGVDAPCRQGQRYRQRHVHLRAAGWVGWGAVQCSGGRE